MSMIAPSQAIPGYSSVLTDGLKGKAHEVFNLTYFFHSQYLFHSSRVIAYWIELLGVLISDLCPCVCADTGFPGEAYSGPPSGACKKTFAIGICGLRLTCNRR